jgi:hypothetical protein
MKRGILVARTTLTEDGFGVLYGNARIRRVENDPLSGTLTITAVCAEGEEQKAVYQDVLYSQADPKAEGKHIAIVVELTPDELRDSKHLRPAARLQSDLGLVSLDALDEMNRRGYRLFCHFIAQREDLLVVAKGLRMT